jgi:siroheme synthase (precorrin-2 oxidase/ferrochelatase)
MADAELVLITRKELEELKELRELKESLPQLLEKARLEVVTQYGIKTLENLHKMDKEFPEKNRERARKWYETHKEYVKNRNKAKKDADAAKELAIIATSLTPQ